MTIVWRPAMSVGNEWIDEDHRKLVDMINAVETALQADDEGKALSATTALQAPTMDDTNERGIATPRREAGAESKAGRTRRIRHACPNAGATSPDAGALLAGVR